MNAGPGHDLLMDYQGPGPRPRLDAEVLLELHAAEPGLRAWLEQAWPSRSSAAACQRHPDPWVDTRWSGPPDPERREGHSRAMRAGRVLDEDVPVVEWPRLVYVDRGRRRPPIPSGDELQTLVPRRLPR